MDAILHALAEPRRREALRLVWQHERAAGEIHALLADVTFGAVSQHLRVLREANLVSVRADGRRRLYTANRDAMGTLGTWLEEMWSVALDELKQLAEDEQHQDSR